MQEHNNLTLKFSESGRIAQLITDKDRIIFEILIHGNMTLPAINASNNRPISKGVPNIFRGECWQLAGYEILDAESETIKEKDI